MTYTEGLPEDIKPVSVNAHVFLPFLKKSKPTDKGLRLFLYLVAPWKADIVPRGWSCWWLSHALCTVRQKGLRAGVGVVRRRTANTIRVSELSQPRPDMSHPIHTGPCNLAFLNSPNSHVP